MLCFYVWLAEREFLQEVLVIHENVKGFKAILVAFIMAKTHVIMSMVVDPRMRGHPMKRPRVVTVCVRKDFELTVDIERFLEMFGLRTVMSPQDLFMLNPELTNAPASSRYFFTADDEEMLDYEQMELSMRAGRKKQRLTHSSPFSHAEIVTWADILLPSHKQRLFDYGRRNEANAHAGRCSINDSIICDLDHNPRKRPRSCIASEAGESLPCLIGHGTLWHTGIRRPMLAAEMLVSMGCNVCPEVGDSDTPPVWPLGLLMENGIIQPNEAINIAGNAWHVPTLGALFMFLLGSMRLRPVEVAGDSSDDTSEGEEQSQRHLRPDQDEDDHSDESREHPTQFVGRHIF